MFENLGKKDNFLFVLLDYRFTLERSVIIWFGFCLLGFWLCLGLRGFWYVCLFGFFFLLHWGLEPFDPTAKSIRESSLIFCLQWVPNVTLYRAHLCLSWKDSTTTNNLLQRSLYAHLRNVFRNFSLLTCFDFLLSKL